MAGKSVRVSEVMAEIEKDTVFYDESDGGVTFSGGEPFAQSLFLLGLLQSCNEKRIHTAVETCGLVGSETLLNFAPYVGLFLYDLKVIDGDIHRKFTGSTNAVILRNLQQLAKVHDHVIVRFPLIPGVNDDDSNLSRLGEFVSSLGKVKEIDVLPYHDLGIEKYKRLGMVNQMPEVKPPSSSSVDRIVEKLEGFGLMVKVGG